MPRAVAFVRCAGLMFGLSAITWLASGCGRTQPPASPGGASSSPSATPNSTAAAGEPELGNSASQPTEQHVAKVPASGTDWAAFRGPTGMGTSSAKGLPMTWSHDEGLAWKAPLSGPGASSPIVFGDRIYLTSYTGFFVPGEEGGSQENLKRHLIALRRTDGSTIWDKAVAAKLPEEKTIRDHGFAANTPAADADRVYVFFGKTGVFAFDHDGKQLWQADVGDRTHGWGTSASPLLHKDFVIINASVESESLVALDRKTGQEKWRQKGIRESWNTPVVIKAPSGRDELIVAIQGKVLAFDPMTGDPLWNCNTDIGWYMVPSIVAADGIVYALGGRTGTAALAVKAGGSGNVTEANRLWTSQKGSNVSSPIYLDGHLYWMHESRATAYCVKAASGDVVYEKRIDRADQVYSSTLLADGKLYYVARNGVTFVLAAKPEYELLATNELRDGSLFNGSPAVDGSRILIRSDKFLYSVGK